MPMPPVSTSSKEQLSPWTSVDTRSRVTPAVGSTMAMRRPASQLNSDDLPTLGRPTMVTIGTATGHLSFVLVPGHSSLATGHSYCKGSEVRITMFKETESSHHGARRLP